MTAISSVTTRRLSIQGFDRTDAAWLAETAPWLRLSPALCALTAAAGTISGSPAILLVLATTACLGAVLPFHPFDLIYNYAIRFWIGKRTLPPNGLPRRFACGMAAVWLVATAYLFATGSITAGYVLGGLFVAVAGLVSTTDICIPSLILHYIGRAVRPAR